MLHQIAQQIAHLPFGQQLIVSLILSSIPTILMNGIYMWLNHWGPSLNKWFKRTTLRMLFRIMIRNYSRIA